MSQSSTPAEVMEGLAADRDDAAERRDLVSEDRDEAADRRDNLADDRGAEDLRAARDSPTGTSSSAGTSSATSPASRTRHRPGRLPDLTPAALDQLHALVAEQRRFAARSRSAIFTLLNEVDDEHFSSPQQPPRRRCW